MSTIITEPASQHGSERDQVQRLCRSSSELREILVCAENWIGAAIIMATNNNREQALERAGQAQALLASINPTPLHEAIRLKDQRIAELMQEVAEVRQHLEAKSQECARLEEEAKLWETRHDICGWMATGTILRATSCALRFDAKATP